MSNPLLHLLGITCLCSATPAIATGFQTSIAPYAKSLTPEYQLKAIISAGDRVPLTYDSSKQFQMVGVPDGLGLAQFSHNYAALFLNHELAGTALTDLIPGESLFRGAVISQFILGCDATVISGHLAYTSIVDTELGLEFPPARVNNTTRTFWRFCSGNVAWKSEGFDRAIYLTGEENPAPNTYDGKGGLAVAIVDGKLHTMPHFGRFQHENAPVRPVKGPQTTLILMEDNGSGYDSQLYMYVGQKKCFGNPNVLERNGLVGGKVYVFVPTTPSKPTEAEFQSGSIAGKWVELPDISGLTEAQLETASDAVGAFGMIKCEDGAWSKTNPNQYFFNTTGDGLNAPGVIGNHLGRTYRLNLNSKNVTGPCSLSILYNADTIVASGGDIALTPDNMDTNKRYLMVCEDGTGFSRNVMAAKGRTGLIWRYDLQNNYAPEPVVSLLTAGRDGVPVSAGIWETSGIIQTERFYGKNSWVFTVQAHPPTAAPASGTVEDGQILLLTPTALHHHHNDDDDDEDEEDHDNDHDEN